jgi:hypothetical protein
MEIGYRLLGGGRGVIPNRNPICTSEDVVFRFENAPIGATAVFACNGAERYRDIAADGSCVVPLRFLNGRVDVSVALFDGTVKPPKWACEGLVATPQEDGKVFIAVNDNDLPEKIANLFCEIDDLRTEFLKVQETSDKVSKRLDSILEGYHLI